MTVYNDKVPWAHQVLQAVTVRLEQRADGVWRPLRTIVEEGSVVAFRLYRRDWPDTREPDGVSGSFLGASGIGVKDAVVKVGTAALATNGWTGGRSRRRTNEASGATGATLGAAGILRHFKRALRAAGNI